MWRLARSFWFRSDAVPLGDVARPDPPVGTGGELVRFVAVGAVCTALYLAMFLLLQGVVGPYWANAISLTATMVINTSAHRRFTFGRRGAGTRRREYLRPPGSTPPASCSRPPPSSSSTRAARRRASPPRRWCSPSSEGSPARSGSCSCPPGSFAIAAHHRGVPMTTPTIPTTDLEVGVAVDEEVATHPAEPGGPAGGLLRRLVRGRPADPAWVRPTLLALLVATLGLYLWGLGRNGWANDFYSAAVQAGSTSWKAFFFGSSDAGNTITVDKPPLSLWPMALSVQAVRPELVVDPRAPGPHGHRHGRRGLRHGATVVHAGRRPRSPG